MSLRTSLQRLTRRDPDAPSLRERLASATASLAETKVRAGTAAKVAGVLMKPPEPEPEPVDRVALVNYATWLHFERTRVCNELYPHMGGKAECFVLTLNAAERFFYPDGISDYRSDAWKRVPPPSTRALQILDLVGVDWRQDLNDDTRRFFDEGGRADTGARSEMPRGWPVPDAALLNAVADLQRLDAMLAAIPSPADHDLDELPEWRALDAARDTAIETLTRTRAKTMPGLQAKAQALLRTSCQHFADPFEAISEGLARDLIGGGQSMIEPKPDPIHARIEAVRGCIRDCEAAQSLPQPPGRIDPLPEQTAASAALHASLDVLVATVPTTARGCARCPTAPDRRRSTCTPSASTACRPWPVETATSRSPGCRCAGSRRCSTGW